MAPGGISPASRLRLRPGTIADYDALARFHYCAGRPATFVHVRTLVDPLEGAPAAVLVVSMPTLDAGWRRRAWPGVFSTGDRSRDARTVNRYLRTISRVVVDPRWRGLGLATRLVRGYLRKPLTPCTEAVAAMGACCPFFQRAGMRALPPEPTDADRRLAAALAGLGLSVERLGRCRRLPPDAERPLRVWLRTRKSGRALARCDGAALAREVYRRYCFRPIAYAHGTVRRPAARGPGGRARSGAGS